MNKWKIIGASIGFGVLYWLIDSLIDFFIFPEGTFAEHLFPSEMTEIRMRFLAMSIVIAFGIFSQFTLNKQKKAEETLKKERDRSQEYLDIAGVMLIAISTDQKVFLINKKGCEILEYNERDIIGKNWFDNFLPERIKEEVTVIFEKVMSGEFKEAEYYENPVLTSRGREKLIAWNNTLLTDKNSKIIGTLSSGEDITNRKKAEEERNQLLAAITKAKKEWEMTFDSAIELMMLIDKTLTIIRCNKSFANFAGIRVQELIGHKCYEFFPCDADQIKYCKNRIETGDMMEWTEVKLKTGQWFYVSHCPIFDEKGNFIHSVIIATDFTAQKNAQQRLVESEEELKKKVEELEKFYDMAVGRELKMKELKKEIKRLNADLSKDIKNPDLIGQGEK